MKIKDRAKAKIPPIEPGVYMAVCIGFVDIGNQYSEFFKHYDNKCIFIWEIPGELVEVDGEMKPRQLSKEFKFSTDSRSNLRKFIESWTGVTYSDEDFAEFDTDDLLGKACQLNVVLNDTKEYASVDYLMAIPKGFPAPKTNTPYINWDMKEWDDDKFQKLPEWIQNKIKKSTEYQEEHAPATVIEIKDASEGCPI